jgi:hypothetical protein
MTLFFAGGMTLEITDEERQMILLALAQLSIARPGWDHALNELAVKMDNVLDGRAMMYEGFRNTAKS